MTEVNERLKAIFYNPKHPAGFAFISKLAKESGIEPKKVKEWLEAQPTYTLHRAAKKNIQHENTLYTILMSSGRLI